MTFVAFSLYSREFLVFVGPLWVFVSFETRILTNHLIRRQKRGQNLYHNQLYYATMARSGSWIVGTSLGFIMYQQSHQITRISKRVSRSLWIFARYKHVDHCHSRTFSIPPTGSISQNIERRQRNLQRSFSILLGDCVGLDNIFLSQWWRWIHSRAFMSFDL